MRVVHDRRRSRREPDALTVEDLLSGQRLDIEVTDAERLPQPLRVPNEYLPPPRVRPRRAAQPAREPESTLSKVAKLTGLATAAGLLVGAVVVSSMMTRERPPAAAANPAPPQITGAAALGGFVPEAAARRPSTGDDRTQGGQAAPAAPSTATSSPSPAAASSAPSSESTAPTTTAARRPGTTERINLVREFYHRMGSQHPQDALAMLAPGLAGDEPGDLVRAWSSMDQIHVDDIEVQPDGTVRAVVTMRQHDGTELRVTQVLSLADDATGVITQAVLLSADQL